jgi:penicillin-binding protein 2
VYLRPEDRARPNRMALRIAVVGGLGVALFAILFFRLWSLQIIEGSENLAEAKNNRTRSTKIVAPRGKIIARNGEVLVDNRTSLALQVDPSKLPEETAAQNAELKELGELVHMKLPAVLRQIKEEEEVVAAGAPVTVRRDVGYDLIYYIEEHHGKFPGVTVEKVFVRNYPEEDMAAQILGHTGEVSEEELKEGPYKGFEPGEVVGKEGLEYSYDNVLRGTPGISRYQVNALGEPTPGGQLTSTPPKPGDSLKLTINPAVQRAGEAALAERGPGGFVTMNVHTGEILGLGSYPTFDPSVWNPLSPKEAKLFFESEISPLTNRAVEGLYPTGSTFKLITAMASLNSGTSTPETRINDPGSITIGGQEFEDSEGVGYGNVDLVEALKYSSDVYFYTLGNEMWKTEALQKWASMLGIGRPTGIDLPQAEGTEGTVPGKQWTEEEIANGAELEPWGPGQNIQLATGQGYLQTDPLEMAVAYATVANGGTVVTPHLGMEVEDPAGRVLKEIDPGPQRHVHVDPTYRSVILEGLHEAAQEQGGTSCSSFCAFPIPVAGKTGTAERSIYKPNQSWYLVLAPYPNPQIVTAVTIEEGGFGAESAAPAAKQILEAYFHNTLKEESEEETKEAENSYEGETAAGVEGEAPVEETESAEAGGIG